MTAPVVCDASAVVALLVDAGPDGRWVAAAVRNATLVAPYLLPFEVAAVILTIAVVAAVMPPSLAEPVSATATGASSVPWIVMVRVWLSKPPAPSLTW